MDDSQYLIAIALVEQGGKRLMPLGGKSLKKASKEDDLINQGESIALELLLRVMHRSEGGALKRAAEGRSLLLARIPMEVMQEKLPSLKSQWIDSGNTESLLLNLKELSQGLWSLNFVKYEGITFVQL